MILAIAEVHNKVKSVANIVYCAVHKVARILFFISSSSFGGIEVP
jgi:hypothetical protein